jgi:hypothetical protein
MTKDAFDINIPLQVSELRVKNGAEVNFDKLSFAGVEDSNGIALQSNYLGFWKNDNGFGRGGLFSMEGDGLAFIYRGSNQMIKDKAKWEMKGTAGYSKKITLGNNIILGSAEENNAPDLVLWGGMVLGETTRVTRVDDGFDIYVT